MPKEGRAYYVQVVHVRISRRKTFNLLDTGEVDCAHIVVYIASIHFAEVAIVVHADQIPRSQAHGVDIETGTVEEVLVFSVLGREARREPRRHFPPAQYPNVRWEAPIEHPDIKDTGLSSPSKSRVVDLGLLELPTCLAWGGALNPGQLLGVRIKLARAESLRQAVGICARTLLGLCPLGVPVGLGVRILRRRLLCRHHAVGAHAQRNHLGAQCDPLAAVRDPPGVQNHTTLALSPAPPS
eukprot:scaffold938_cov399-Prasinococcus_capsulatus_cf.AAC.2